MVIMSFMFQRINIKMSPRSSTPCRDDIKARPTSGNEKKQSQGSLVDCQPTVMLRKDISTTLKVPTPKQSRGKEIPPSFSNQARQSSKVKVVEEGVSGISVLQRPVKKRTTKPEPSPPPQQSAKKVSSKRRASSHSSGKVEKPATPFYRVRHSKPARVRIQNYQRAVAMLHRMQITGEGLTTAQDRLGCLVYR
jgi:hypothetical protein